MRSPLEDGAAWLEFEALPSTQTLLAEKIRAGENVGVVFAKDQTAGRGRFDRTWLSQPGESMTMSMAFPAYADHPRPYLIGMSVAVAAAGLLRSHLRWPNDLTFEGHKLGGILTEIITDPAGRRIPVVGIGVNLNQREFPEAVSEIATSIFRIHGRDSDPLSIAKKLIERLEDIPEPAHWKDLEPAWTIFDRTPGKIYRMTSGELAVALGVGSDGQLICSIDGESHSVLAADAIFGS